MILNLQEANLKYRNLLHKTYMMLSEEDKITLFSHIESSEDIALMDKYQSFLDITKLLKYLSHYTSIEGEEKWPILWIGNEENKVNVNWDTRKLSIPEHLFFNSKEKQPSDLIIFECDRFYSIHDLNSQNWKFYVKVNDEIELLDMIYHDVENNKILVGWLPTFTENIKSLNITFYASYAGGGAAEGIETKPANIKIV